MSQESDALYDRVSEQETQLERQAIQIESLESEIENLKKRMDKMLKPYVRPERMIREELDHD